MVTSIYSVAKAAKSTSIALALIMKEAISIQEAFYAARCDEHYQMKVYGMVEGAHDLEDAATMA